MDSDNLYPKVTSASAYLLALVYFYNLYLYSHFINTIQPLRL